MFKRRVTSASLATSVAIMLMATPALSAPIVPKPTGGPIVLNPNFTVNDTAANNSSNGGGLYYVQNWVPTDFASNTNTDPSQYDNGSAGGQTVVGFLSGASTSLTQVVMGFVIGRTYQVLVGANSRSGVNANPTFRILADSVQVYGPSALTPVNPAGIFTTAFTPIKSDSFVAGNTFVTITFANASTSNANASTLLTNASVSQIPEPISITIMSLGLVGIYVGRRRCGKTA